MINKFLHHEIIYGFNKLIKIYGIIFLRMINKYEFFQSIPYIDIDPYCLATIPEEVALLV